MQKRTPSFPVVLFASALLCACGAPPPRGGARGGGGPAVGGADDDGGEGEGDGAQAGGEGLPEPGDADEGGAGGGAQQPGGEAPDGEGTGGEPGEGDDAGQPGDGHEDGGGEGEGEGEEVEPDPDADPDPDPEDPPIELEPGDLGYTFVLNTLSVGGEAFDLDGDGRGDNALGLAGLFVNPQIAQSIGAELLVIMGLHAEDPEDDGPFALDVVTGEDVDANPNNNLVPGAQLAVDPASLGDDGLPLAHTDEAVIEGGELRAAPGELALSIPDAAGGTIDLALRFVRVEATVVGEFGRLDAGRLGGAVKEQDIRAALEALPIDPGMRPMIDGFLRNPDIDADGDGRADSFSIAMQFTGVACELLF